MSCVCVCVAGSYLSQASELRVFISHHLVLILFIFGILSIGNSHCKILMNNHDSCSLTNTKKENCQQVDKCDGGGPRILLIVFIALYYTYTMAKHYYPSNRMMAYHHLTAKHCRRAGSISKIGPNQRQENCQQVDTKV